MTSLKQAFEPLASFFSSNYTQTFLQKNYSHLHVPEAEKKGYENCYPFIYYLEHGQNYYNLAERAPLSIQPTLLFYGMTQLMKACLLTVDPMYPETTTVLAHGVTTRKRKKKYYEFLKDEVKIQKNGLFTHVSTKMFHILHNESDKYTMEQLLMVIPEIQKLFGQKITMYEAVLDKDFLLIPQKVLDSYHMTYDRFSTYLSTIAPYLHPAHMTKEHIFFQCTEKILPFSCYPFSFHIEKETLYLPSTRERIVPLPELLIHYLLLYNLSNISRYETEWWYHMLHHYEGLDYPFMQTFLTTTAVKGPFLISSFLNEKRTSLI